MKCSSLQLPLHYIINSIGTCSTLNIHNQGVGTTNNIPVYHLSPAFPCHHFQQRGAQVVPDGWVPDHLVPEDHQPQVVHIVHIVLLYINSVLQNTQRVYVNTYRSHWQVPLWHEKLILGTGGEKSPYQNLFRPEYVIQRTIFNSCVKQTFKYITRILQYL